MFGPVLNSCMPATKLRVENCLQYVVALAEQNTYVLTQIIEDVCIRKRQKDPTMTKMEVARAYFGAEQDLSQHNL